MAEDTKTTIVQLDSSSDVDQIPDEEIKEAVIDINGRNVTLRQLTSTNIMQLQHESTVLQQDNVHIDRKRKSIARVFRILRSAVAEDDRDYVEDLMADGDLDMQQLVRLVIRMHKVNAPSPQPKVRRGRTPRAR